ncbi:MAG: hypothetical protein ACK4U0_19145 [Mesorhizobium sp.]
MPLDVTYATTEMEPTRVLRALPRKRLVAMAMAAVVAHGVPERFLADGVILVASETRIEAVPSEMWARVTPHEGADVRFVLLPAGGDGGGVKNVLGIVASIALTLATAGIATAGIGALGLAAGSLGARVVAGAVGLIGQLAIQALFAPPEQAKQRETEQATRSSIAGNPLQRGQTLPLVAGTLRMTPPLIVQPRTYLDGDDSYAEAVFALAGPHALSAPQINGVAVTDLNDIEIWIDDGTAGTRTNQFSAYAVTQQVGAQLGVHATRAGESGYNDTELVDQAFPRRSLPKWHRVTARAGCDYADMLLTIGSLYDSSAGDTRQVIWLRFRARKEGDAGWKNIGTVAYVGKGQSSYNRRVRFHFAAYPGGITEEPRSRHGFRAPATLPVVTVNHLDFLTTDSDHFPAAYSHDWIRDREGIDCWLNDAYYLDTSARYEFEVMRSEMVEIGDLANDTTAVQTMQRGGDNAYVDYFDARLTSGTWRAQEDMGDQGDVIVLQAMASVYEDAPIPTDAPIATIQIRAKNRDVPQLSILASALVPDLVDGVWTGAVATSNPAAHYRHALTGARTARPIDTAYVDDEVLADWHAECAAQGHSVNLLVEGTLEEAMEGIAACGYARPTAGLKYGVIYHRDTTAETAMHMFTPRNIRDLEWSVPFSKRPGAFNISFINAALNYETDELLVEDPYPIPGGESEIEAVSYPGLTTAAAVTARAEFDFVQARHATRWSFLTSIEHNVISPGDLAVLSHDQLDEHAGYARISDVPSATTFMIDSTVEIVVADGWGVAVRTPGAGVVEMAIVDYDPETRTVTVSDTDGLTEGDLCAFGPTTNETRRVQVLSVEPESLHLARVTCQPELTEPEE